MKAKKCRLFLLATLSCVFLFEGLIFDCDLARGQQTPQRAVHEKIVWKCSFGGPPRAPLDQYVWVFNELNKRTGGQFEVKIFWNSTLAPIEQTFRGIQAGTFEAGFNSPAYTPAQTPLSGFSYAPLLVPVDPHFSDMWHWNYEFAQIPEIKQELAKMDVMLMLPWVCDQYMLMTTKPVRNTGDLSGLRTRDIPPSAKVLQRFGARIVAVPPTETYEALQRNTLDAVFMSGTGGKTFGWNEVCRYYVDKMNLKTGNFPLYCSKSKFEALPQNVKDVYNQLLKESPAFSAALWDRLLKEAYEAFEKKGVQRIEWSAQEKEKLFAVGREILLKDYVEPLEAKGLPARKVYNAAVEISRKYGIKGLPNL